MSRRGCHAGSDGECFWDECPQRLEYRVRCPLDNVCPVCHGEESGPNCRCDGTGRVLLESVALPPLASVRASDELAAPPATSPDAGVEQL